MSAGTLEPLPGRAGELTRLDDALEDARTNGPRIVLCCGAPGSGRTALLTAFVHRAAARGASVVWPAVFPRPGAPPHWIWQQVAGSHGASDSLSGVADRATAVDGLAHHLRTLATQGPVILVLDDVDHADSTSLATLPQVLRALGPSQLLVCCADESGQPPSKDWAAARRAVAAVAATEEVVLSGLQVEHVRRLLVLSGLNARQARHRVRNGLEGERAVTWWQRFGQFQQTEPLPASGGTGPSEMKRRFPLAFRDGGQQQGALGCTVGEQAGVAGSRSSNRPQQVAGHLSNPGGGQQQVAVTAILEWYSQSQAHDVWEWLW